MTVNTTHEEAQDRLAAAKAEYTAARIEVERLDPDLKYDRQRWLVRKLDAAMRHLRDAEDYARLDANFQGMPTADRIRFIYEQITDDIYNGQSSKAGTFEETCFKAMGSNLTAIILEMHESPKTMRAQGVAVTDRKAFLAGVDALASKLGLTGLVQAEEERRRGT